MSSHQVSGAIAYQEGQGRDQVHRWRAFAVLAVSFFMTVADLAIVNVALPTIGRVGVLGLRRNRPGRGPGDLPPGPPQRASHGGGPHIPEASAST